MYGQHRAGLSQLGRFGQCARVFCTDEANVVADLPDRQCMGVKGGERRDSDHCGDAMPVLEGAIGRQWGATDRSREQNRATQLSLPLASQLHPAPAAVGLLFWGFRPSPRLVGSPVCSEARTFRYVGSIACHLNGITRRRAWPRHCPIWRQTKILNSCSPPLPLQRYPIGSRKSSCRQLLGLGVLMIVR